MLSHLLSLQGPKPFLFEVHLLNSLINSFGESSTENQAWLITYLIS